MQVKRFQRSICWIRRDLRLHDHAALAAAADESSEVVVVFAFDTTILGALEDRADKRVSFIYDCLIELDEALHKHGSRLVVLHGDPVVEIPKLAQSLNVEAVYTNRDYEPMAILRDSIVRKSLSALAIEFLTYKDQVVFEDKEVLTAAGTVHKVYTPFMRAWRARLEHSDIEDRIVDESCMCPMEVLESVPNLQQIEAYGFSKVSNWLKPGMAGGGERLREFVANQIESYNDNRDYPDSNSTSALSVHLRFGTVSIRQAFREAMSHNSVGAEKWVNELIWREFYQMILANFPHVDGHAFKPEFEDIQWPGSEEHFIAWCEGRTGYPIVDAAMRCLNETGWMHNRLRMVAASFLCKDLLVDWRKGESYFAKKLLDFDLASNNGGWQWCASTGVDAQPTFRIFNPWLQSAKFDAKGRFIRKWVPEIAGFSDQHIHKPSEATPLEQLEAGSRIPEDYPAPIVEHSIQRELALKLLRSRN